MSEQQSWSSPTPEHFWRHFIVRLEVLYRLLKGQTRAELEGRRSSGFDQTGVHTHSMLWGEIVMLCNLYPDLWELEPVYRWVADAAREDGIRDFLECANSAKRELKTS